MTHHENIELASKKILNPTRCASTLNVRHLHFETLSYEIAEFSMQKSGFIMEWRPIIWDGFCSTYNLQWQDAMLNLIELVKAETPTDISKWPTVY